MRIAFPTPDYVTNDTFGGLAAYIYKTSKYLLKLNHEPIVFLLGDNEGIIFHEGVEVIQVKRKKHWWFWLLNILTFFVFNTTFLILNYSWSIKNAISKYDKRRKISIIQYSNAQFLSIIRPSDIPFCLRLSHYYKIYSQYIYEKPNSFKNIQKHLIEKICIKKSKELVYAPSILIGDLVRRDLKTPVKLIRTPYFNNGDKIHLRKKTGQIRLLYFGTLSYSKGVDILVNVLPLILKEHPQIQMNFVGRDTPLHIKDISILSKALESIFRTKTTSNKKMFSHHIRERLNEFDSRLEISSIIKPKAMQKILHTSDIVILPSRIDNFPNTLSESLSAGKIVIVPTKSSLDEIVIDNQNGFVFQNGCSRDLYCKIKTVLTLTHRDVSRIKHNALESVKELKPEKVIESDLLPFYNDIVT